MQVIRFLGVRCGYGLLVFVAGYFALFSGSSRRASWNFLERVLGLQPLWRRLLLVFRHFCSHGTTLVDRLAVIMGRSRIECSFEGEELFRDYFDRGKGVILLGAHLGNWEIGGHFLGRFGIPVNVVVLEREEARVRQLLAKALESRNFRLLTTDEHPLRSIPIVAALRRGEIVALHGDRSFGGADRVCDFLGGKARFPVGPYLLAGASGAPLFQVFAVREKLGKYRFFTYPPWTISKDMLRKPPEALDAFIGEYAARLECIARQYPFQWYNIYDFWEPARRISAPIATRAAEARLNLSEETR